MRAGTSRLPYFSCPPVLVFPSTTPPSIVLSSRHQASWTYPPLPLSLPPSGGNTIAGLRDTYISGDLEFDPLGTYAGCGLRNRKAKNYHVEFREDEVAHPHEGWSNSSLCASCLSPAATCSSSSPRFVLFVSRPPLPSLFPPPRHNAGLAPTSDANAFINRRSKELNNGRLAMLAWAGMVVQELVTNSKIFS